MSANGDGSPKHPKKKWRRRFGRDLALDLGCSTLRIYATGEGVVASEPNVVAVRRRSRDVGEIIAVGAAASRMIGRTPPDVGLVHPISGGGISSFEDLDAILRAFLPKPGLFGRLRRPRIVVAVPLDLSAIEQRAVHEIAELVGGRDVKLVPKILAAAIGAGLPVTAPAGHFVLDVGGGTTEMAVVSLSGIVATSACRVGGIDMNDALRRYVKRKCSLWIGDETAERLKVELGTAHPTDALSSLEIRGRDVVSGVPRTIELGIEEVREALEEPVTAIVAAVRDTLERTPPELCADVLERGIVMVGGGSLLANLDFRLREATGLPAFRAEAPLDAVVLGAGRIAEDPSAYEGVSL